MPSAHSGSRVLDVGVAASRTGGFCQCDHSSGADRGPTEEVALTGLHAESGDREVPYASRFLRQSGWRRFLLRT
jgi:hypothetical protein